MDMQSLLGQLGAGSSPNYSFSDQVSNPAIQPPKPNFAANVASSAGHIVAGAAGWLGHAITDPITGLGHDVNNIIQANQQNHFNSQAIDQLNSQLQQYSRAYRAGKISTPRYQALLKDHQKQLDQINQSLKQTGQSLPSQGKAAMDVLGTAVTPLAFGRLTATGAKGALGAAERLAGASSKAAGSPIMRSGKALVKNALIEQPLAQSAVQTAQDVKHGNIAGAAGNAAVIAGVPLGIAGVSKFGPGAIAKAGQAFFGKEGILDTALGQRVVQYAEQHPEDVKSLKRMEQFTLNQPSVKAGHNPGQFLAQHLQDIGVDPQNTSIKDILNQFDSYAGNVSKVDKAIAAGKAPENAVVTHNFQGIVPKIIKGLEDSSKANPELAATMQGRVDLAKQVMSDLNIKNETLKSRAIKAIVEAPSTSDLKTELNQIVQKQIIKIPGLKLDKGFAVTYGPNERAAMPKLGEVSGELQLGKEANPILGKVGSALEKSGLSPRGAAKGQLQGALIKNLDSQFAGTKFDGQGKEILMSLQKAMSQTKGVYDPRLLRVASGRTVNIEDALNLSRKDAGMISKAIKKAYGDVPLGIRSLGDKLTDKAIQHTGPVMSNYLKAQGYGRFTFNPFFWAKQATKSEFIAQAETGGKALNLGKILNKAIGTAPSQETEQLLKNEGWFAKGQQTAGTEGDFFGTSLPDEVIKNVKSSDVSSYIRQSLGQAAEKFARSQGTTVGDIIKENGPAKQEMDRLLQMIVGYPKDGYLTSNLAKTLNVLVFPSKFELKVGMAAAKFLSKQPPVAQGAFVNSLLNAHDWLNSPEGNKWQQDNADLLGAIDYFSPTHTFESVMKTLGSRSLGDLGSIGGMPFGVITTMLKHQGVAVPDVIAGSDINPKTGQAYFENLPTSDKARLQQGLTDLVGSLFSYPGKTVGLKSKTSLIQEDLSGGLLKPAKGETKLVGPDPLAQPSASKQVSVGLAPGQTLSRPNPSIKQISVQPTAKSGSTKLKRTKTVPKNLQILP